MPLRRKFQSARPTTTKVRVLNPKGLLRFYDTLVDIGVIAEKAPSSATCGALDFITNATHSVESRMLYLNSVIS